MNIDEKQVNNTKNQLTLFLNVRTQKDFLLRSTKYHILTGIIIEAFLDQPVRQQQKQHKRIKLSLQIT